MRTKIYKCVLFFNLIICSVCLIGCTALPTDSTIVEETESSGATEITEIKEDDMFSKKDTDSTYNEAENTIIDMTEDSITTDSSDIVAQDNNVYITSEGKYTFNGNYNGTIVVNVADTEKVYLTLNNACITSNNYAAIYILSADKVFLNLIGQNYVKNTGTFVQTDDNTVDGAIFSKEDITIYGTGSLEVTSTGHGIVGKDDVKITEGNVSITSSGHGINANDSVRITTASISIHSTKDGIHCENLEDTTLGYIYYESGTLNITAGYDGLDSSSAIQINGGEIKITAGGGSSKAASSTISTKGIKATGSILLCGGVVNISSSDDAIHSNGSISITGGQTTVSSADDGIHADSTLCIENGKVTVSKSYEGLEAQTIEIKGGDISVVATDDGINAAGGNDSSSIGGRPGQNNFTSSTGSIVISGGALYVNSTGDGVDSNGTLSITGGVTIVEGPTNSGNGALDYDGTGSITGGIFIAIGSSGMAMNFTSSTQGSILYSLSSTIKAGSIISISDSTSELYTFTCTKSFNSIVVSMPQMIKGGTYTIQAGTVSQIFTLSSLIYGGGSSGGGGGFFPR